MANFPTHLVGAAVGSSVAASIFAQVHAVSAPRALLLISIGTVGGLLPDIDSDHSVPARWVRGAIATAIGVMAVSSLWITHAPAVALALGCCAGIGGYMVVEHVVNRWTVHRGIVHSIPFGLLCVFLMAIATHRLLLLPAVEAWWMASFLGAGFLIHLSLDEIASVDITSARVKRSFGTALKLWDRSVVKTIAVYALLFVAFSAVPSFVDFVSQARALFLAMSAWVA